MLLKKQRNDLFRILLDLGISPSEFREEYTDSDYYIHLNRTKFNFDINYRASHYAVYSKPEIPSTKTPQGGAAIVGWPTVLTRFETWASIMKEEIETPDLWAEARANALLFASNLATPDEIFSDNELRQLQGQIRQIEQGIMALGLPAAAQQALIGAIKEAPEKATRFTKKEWQGWFIGAVVAQVTNLALSPEHVAAVAQLLKNTFMGLLQLH